MRRVFTKTFFRFLIAFLAILAISCSMMVLTSSVAGGRAPASVISSFFK